MNTQAGDNHDQVASALRNIMQHYNTELELQQVVELSAVYEKIRRLQVKRTAIVAETVDPSTSNPNPNLCAPQSATINPFAQHFASTLPFPIPQLWTMSGYATPFQTSLFGVPGGQLMAVAGTKVGLQLPTSMSQPPAQPPLGDSALSYRRLSGSAGPYQNFPVPNPDPDPEKKTRDKAIDAKRIGRCLIDSESLRSAKGRLRGNMKCDVERYERGQN